MSAPATRPHRLARLLAAAVAGVLVAGIGAMTVPSAAADPVRPRASVPSGTFTLGDSVMLGAKWALRDRDFAVDAAVNRQATAAPAVLRARGAKLPRNVVVHLGTNGTFDLRTCKRIVRTAGDQRVVYFVTIHADRRWVDGNNKVIRACDAAFAPQRVRVIDWDWAADRHGGWTYSDGIHLRPQGARNYARIVATAVDGASAR